MEEQNNVVVQEPKKKSPIGIIILIVILMIGCLVGGYFLNESGIFNKDKENTQEKDKDKKDEKEPVVTVYDVTDEKVANLITNLMHSGGDCQVLKVYANDHKVVANDISIDIAYRIAEPEMYNSGNGRESYTLDEVTAIVQKYLGKDYRFNPTDQMGKGQCYTYYYEGSNKTFVRQQTACGWTCGPRTSYKLIKAVDTDGTLVLDTKVIFAKYDNGTNYDYFSDYEATNGIGTFDDDINTLYDKGSDYIFTFKLEDNNYVFVSSEPAK